MASLLTCALVTPPHRTEGLEIPCSAIKTRLAFLGFPKSPGKPRRPEGFDTSNQRTTRRLPVRRDHLAGWYTHISPDHLLPKLNHPATVGANSDIFTGLGIHRAALARYDITILAFAGRNTRGNIWYRCFFMPFKSNRFYACRGARRLPNLSHPSDSLNSRNMTIPRASDTKHGVRNESQRHHDEQNLTKRLRGQRSKRLA